MTIAQGHGAAEMGIYFPPQARTGRLSELVRNRSRKPASLCGLGVRIAHLPPIAHLREHVALSDCRSTVEHLTFNQGIAGSTPVSPTISENSGGQTLRRPRSRPPLHTCVENGLLVAHLQERWARVLLPLSGASGYGTNCPFVVNMRHDGIGP